MEKPMNPEGKITIKDVARLSGLSKGTVDRVIHNRGEVSKKSYDKVMKVIEELGYEPNIFASMLASRKEHVVAAILPFYEKGEFWELLEEGLRRAAEAEKTFGVKVVRIGYNQYDLESFREACEEALGMNPSGVVIAPMFKNDTLSFAGALREKDIPYVFIDSKIEDDGYLAYYGMPMYQSGYLCAYLLSGGREIGNVAIIRIRRDKNSQSDPTINRRAGFMDYFAEHYPESEVSNVFIDPHDPESIDSTLDVFFKEHPDVRHIVMFNSRIHLVAAYLEKHGMESCRVIGFDNLERNLSALRRGTVDMLITQHPDEQVYNAISTLSDKIVLKKEPQHKDNFMHMDILTRYNVDYY